jgi:hypothetical protein
MRRAKLGRTGPGAPFVAGLAVLTLFSGAFAACGDDDGNDVRSTASSVADDVKSGASEVGRDAAETAARNIATEQGEEQFKKAGNELDGKLSCEASAEGGAEAVSITCSGQTKAGKQAALSGTTNEVPGASVTELEGNFVGTVDGQQVFQTTKLGD